MASTPAAGYSALPEWKPATATHAGLHVHWVVRRFFQTFKGTAMTSMLRIAELVPKALQAEAVVSKAEPSLQVSDDEVRGYLRACMAADEIQLEFDAIHDLAAARLAFGDFGILGLKPMAGAYSCVDSGPNSRIWLHDHERKRLHQLWLALPSPAEQMAAAQERIRQRIKSRMLRRGLDGAAWGA
ncbi:hypothetical protein ACEP28_04930 [Pseudomonas aeruginosa]|nr:hypothetical protein [Pseudomonas aeruginosa]